MRKCLAHQFQSERGLWETMWEKQPSRDQGQCRRRGRRGSRAAQGTPVGGSCALEPVRSMVEQSPACSPWRIPPQSQYSILPYSTPWKGLGEQRHPLLPGQLSSCSHITLGSGLPLLEFSNATKVSHCSLCHGQVLRVFHCPYIWLDFPHQVISPNRKHLTHSHTQRRTDSKLCHWLEQNTAWSGSTDHQGEANLMLFIPDVYLSSNLSVWWSTAPRRIIYIPWGCFVNSQEAGKGIEYPTGCGQAVSDPNDLKYQ